MQKLLSYSEPIRTEPSADTRDRARSDQQTSTRFGWKTFELEHHRLRQAGELIEIKLTVADEVPRHHH